MNYIKLLNNACAFFSSGRKAVDNDPMIFVCGVSRSGTTLLSAILDAHSKICMGYEMNFPPMQGIDNIEKQLAPIIQEVDNLKQAGSRLRKQGHNSLGKWISRCHRLGIEPQDLVAALEEHKRSNGNSLLSSVKRWILIKRVLDIPKKKKNAAYTGFKVTDSMFPEYLALFPNSFFVYIVRDPRDVFSSLKEREFNVSLSTSCNNWNKGLLSFEEFQAAHPERCHLLRYEDLVTNSRETVEQLFQKLSLPLEENVVDFHKSDASILESSHPNASNLKKGFFNSHVNRFYHDLISSEIEQINANCSGYLNKYGYMDSISIKYNDNQLYSLSSMEKSKKKQFLETKKKYTEQEYDDLLKPYLDEEYEVMTHLEYIRTEDVGNRKILIIRHDVDHDHMTANKIAKWEHDHGIRSTFCLLHTSWYYGRLENGRIVHTQDLVDCAQYIASLGHEINFHNNLVATALKLGIDPVEILSQEIDFFDSIGIDIKGTSTHGDALCRELNFRNWELFKECCDDRFGGPRTVKSENGRTEVPLGKYSMFDFGLEYEAYDMGKDIYHTDSGGKLRTRHNTKARKEFGYKNKDGKVVGVLTHPIWWCF